MTTQDRFALIRPDLDRLEHKLRDVSDVTYPPLATVITQLVSAGGKRLRPAVSLLVNQMYPTDPARALSLAAAVEMLHTATLVHDDLIDEAALRRGHPTVNAVWSPIATVWAGDYMFGRAAGYVAETGNAEVVGLFAETLRVIVAGELRQLFNRVEGLPSRDDYYARIYGKTAALFALAAQAGAVLGGAPAESATRLHDYGYHYGMAFQVMDDILDFTADEKTLGKPVGGDLREGIITLPVLIYAEQTPNAPALRRMWEYRTDGANRLSAVDEVVAAVRDSAAIEAARDEARGMAARAEAALADVPASSARDMLADLAAAAVIRRE